TISDIRFRPAYISESRRKIQLGFPDISGYGFEGILIKYPGELNQQAFPFNIHKTAPVHPRGNRSHPRVPKEHGSNLQAQSDQHSLNL
ncbi:MAG: hypothetical protein Q8R04_03415, partial [Nanoarchaeota archaeon]|nr:hypothetical protein [Nanoarchaeota archaeon]